MGYTIYDQGGIEMKLSVLTCDNCNGSFEYEDDACMPDGEVVGSCWYCSNCCWLGLWDHEESK